MKNAKKYLNARSEYIKLIKAELMGPGSEISIPDAEHELLSSSPDKRYSIGVLYTKYNKFKMDNNDPQRVENTEDELEDEGPNDGENTIVHSKSEVMTSAEEDNLDEEIGLATQNMPSSMGLTFLTENDVDRLTVKIKFATYKRALYTDCRVPFIPRNPAEYNLPIELSNIAYFDSAERTLKLCRKGVTKKELYNIREKDIFDEGEDDLFPALIKLCNQQEKGYVRVPHELEVVVDFSDRLYVDDNNKLDETNAKVTALKRKLSDDLYSFTVMLVNDDDRDSNGLRCIYQPEILIDAHNNDISFREYSSLIDFSGLDKEEQSLELQYRNKKVYATGLGTSVDWEIDNNGKGWIHTEYFPIAEVPPMNFELSTEDVDKRALSMKFLSDLNTSNKTEKIELLKQIIDSYNTWIEKISAKALKLENKYQSIAFENIDGCWKSSERMSRGLQLLSDNSDIWDAFQLANRAMFMQRVHIELQKKTASKDRYPGDEELCSLLENIYYSSNEGLTSDDYFWRPFQIAFLLMSIGAVVEENSAAHNVVDLIWFPTGGGKTEAYLGLTAFTIFYRRLAKKNESNGTTVIMRYTLRLLAAQQFTRAATLICACEYIRKDSLSKRSKYKQYPLGNQEISIGLWIGNEHIPNKNSEAKKHLKELITASVQNLQYAKEMHNKFQVLKCPWCGTKMVKDRVGNSMIGSFGYRMRNNRHFELFCPQESCFFNQIDKLPIQIIDEELYAAPPTLLFGTVDKFAMIPWKKEIGNFFATSTKENRPPELIIQDELHLISGPLGTMVGLYESIIDELCQKKGHSPKIVASTATIRRAKEQCAALYNRNVNQFPHPGIDAEDSFFAKEAIIDYEKGVFGRTYVGLMPSGKSKAMMEIRSIAALMQKINTMQLEDEVKDKYWTLTVYFNSLKDLGKCTTLVEDDVKEYIRRTAYRLGTGKDARMVGRADELTSRVTTTQLNETLDKLEKVEYSQENNQNKKYASNILLATNMISVGIDVARLNVMLLVGQPKLTSEYIQASSRIGRTFPGVAFAMYDGSKSRDRSHYEQFKPYHESFYKHVEPTGATPFSKPARDRALHAVVIALLRMTEDELMPEKGAALFTREKYKDRITEITNYLIDRSSEITSRLNSNMKNDANTIAIEIKSILERWEKMAENYDEEHFCYGESFMFSPPEENEGRLLKPFNTSVHDPAFNTMTSMRNVDSTVRSNILVWEDK